MTGFAEDMDPVALEARKRLLMERCRKFVADNQILCPETIYQTDWVIQNAYEFIEDICNIVGYCPCEDEE